MTLLLSAGQLLCHQPWYLSVHLGLGTSQQSTPASWVKSLPGSPEFTSFLKAPLQLTYITTWDKPKMLPIICSIRQEVHALFPHEPLPSHWVVRKNAAQPQRADNAQITNYTWNISENRLWKQSFEKRGLLERSVQRNSGKGRNEQDSAEWCFHTATAASLEQPIERS